MSVRKSLAWSYGAQAFVFVLTFCVSVIVARLLGPYEMGVFAIAMATAGLLSILSAFGIAPYLMRHESPDAGVLAASFTINALLNVAVALGILGTALIGPAFGLDRAVRNVMLLLVIAPLGGIFDFLPGVFLQREMQFRVLSLITVGRAVCTSSILLCSAWLGAGALSPALAIVGSGLISTLALNIVARRHVSVRIGLTGWRDITRFGLQMMSIGGLATLVQRMSDLILGRLLGTAALGVFSRASGLSNQIWDNVYGLSTRVIFARMAEEMRATGSMHATFLNGLAMLTALIWPLLLGIAVLSRPLIHTLYGEAWMAAAAPLSLLMIAQAVVLGFGMNWEVCVLAKRTGWQARIEVTRSAVGLVAFTAGAWFSLVGAAAARVFEAIVGLLLYGPSMTQMAGAPPGEIGRLYRQSGVLAVVAVGPAAVLMAASGWSPSLSWWAIGPAVVTGIVFWLLMLDRMMHPLFNEIRQAYTLVTQRFMRRTA